MAETVQMPKLGFDMAEGTLVRWVKGEGEQVNKGEILAEIETDKATVEVECPYSGVVARQLVAEKDVVPVGTPIAIIGAPGEQVDMPAQAPESAPKPSPEQQPQAQAQPAAPTPEAPVYGPVKASPLARRMAADARVDLSLVRGSGPGGRIVRRDIEAALSVPAASPTPSPKTAQVPLVSAPITAAAADERVPVDKLRAAIARRMVESKQQLPHFYVTREYDVEALLALRKQVNELLPEDSRLSVNDFVVKAAALCLRQFPNLNASLSGSEIIRRGNINIGVAVALENGLLTVVSRDADLKPIRQISAEVREMVTRARAGKVRTEDIEGSTFSISNLGMFDVDHFTAIINPPEAAILAVGAARSVPVVKGGEVRPGVRMKITISVDHRVSDGAEAAQFMQALGNFLEKPLTLLV